MAVTKIIETLDISKGWLQAQNISGQHGSFIIGIKGSSTDSSAMPISDLKYVSLEIGIPSGIENKPITLQTIKLNFDDITSFDDAQLDAQTACVKIGPMPSTIYIRPIAYGSIRGEIKEGIMPVNINVLTF